MTNPIYNHTTYPTASSSLSSSAMRTELDTLTTGLNAFPNFAGNALKILGVNAGETAYSAVSTTGTGNVVLATSPTLTTPTIGVATATSVNKNTFTAPATNCTWTLADGKTFSCSNTITISGTDSSTLNIGSGGTLGSVAYGGVVPANLGGTGIANNAASTITISGNFGTTFTVTGITSVTLPTSGTLAKTTQATDTFGALTDVTTNNVSASAHGFVPKYPNNTTTFFRGDGTYATPPAATFTRSARTSNTIIAATDNFTLIDITSGTFAQTFNLVSSLGIIHFRIHNSGTGTITLTPNVADTIDGMVSYPMYPGEIRDFYTDGTNAIITKVISPFCMTILSSITFTRPPGYTFFNGYLWAGGGSGGYGAAGFATGGGGGGACTPFLISYTSMGASQTITIGAGGVGIVAAGNGNAGGTTSIGSISYAYGGGGGGGSASNNCSGGGGGGTFGVGGTGSSGATFTDGGLPLLATNGVFGNSGFGGGIGMGTALGVGGGNSSFGGGGGGYSSMTAGKSLYGGGGGGSIDAANAAAIAGTSMYGGNGATASVAGTPTAGIVPGGGGGATHSGAASGAGGDGQVIMWGII